jgi:hypothetical protein
MQSEAAHRVGNAARATPKLWDRLKVGIGAYLDICAEPAYARIVIHEAPTVLGNERYREIEEQYPFALLKATFVALKQKGEIDFEDVVLLARLVDAQICELATMLSTASEPAKLRKNGLRIVDALVDAFRPGR